MKRHLERRRRRLSDERGETLLELLIAITIMAVAVVAIGGGVVASILVSDVNRKQATAAADVRDYAEAIESAVAGGGYVPGAGTGSYPSYLLSGYAASVTSVRCWTGSAWTGCTVANDIGVQQLTLQVASSDQRAVEKLVVIVRKPCTPSAPCTS